MRYISLIVGLCCFTSITSCTTSQNIAGNKSALCNLPFPRIATNEFSHPDTARCRKAAQRFFNNTHIDPLTGESFSKTKLNDSLYMWSGALDTEVRFVVRSSDSLPQVLNYWKITSSNNDGPKELEKKIKDVVQKIITGCGCKTIPGYGVKEDAQSVRSDKKKAWRAIISCPNKNTPTSPGMRMLQVEDDVFGIVINPSYP